MSDVLITIPSPSMIFIREASALAAPKVDSKRRRSFLSRHHSAPERNVFIESGTLPPKSPDGSAPTTTYW